MLSALKEFRLMTEYRFLEVLRDHFSKSCKSVEKTREDMGYPILVRRKLVIHYVAVRNVT